MRNGAALFGPGVADRLLQSVSGRTRTPNPFPELSARELQILGLMAAEHDNADIANRLSIAPKTVRNTISTILTKIQAPNRTAAITRARQAGLGDNRRDQTAY